MVNKTKLGPSLAPLLPGERERARRPGSAPPVLAAASALAAAVGCGSGSSPTPQTPQCLGSRVRVSPTARDASAAAARLPPPPPGTTRRREVVRLSRPGGVFASRLRAARPADAPGCAPFRRRGASAWAR